MKQLDAVWQALIDIPTRERRADTDFARQAAVALALLGEHARQLSACAYPQRTRALYRLGKKLAISLTLCVGKIG